jgi:hypothetical protein
MAEIHPAATQHLPAFITAPGETDVLMVVMAIILVLSVLGFGLFYFRLHSLPERMAHRTHKMQFELVAVLCLISLFTHMHIFWIIGLLLAFIDLPDFGTPLNRIAGSAERVAGLRPGEGALLQPSDAVADRPPDEDASAAPGQPRAEPGSGAAAPPARPETAPTKPKELIHA